MGVCQYLLPNHCDRPNGSVTISVTISPVTNLFQDKRETAQPSWLSGLFMSSHYKKDFFISPKNFNANPYFIKFNLINIPRFLTIDFNYLLRLKNLNQWLGKFCVQMVMPFGR